MCKIKPTPTYYYGSNLYEMNTRGLISLNGTPISQFVFFPSTYILFICIYVFLHKILLEVETYMALRVMSLISGLSISAWMYSVVIF